MRPHLGVGDVLDWDGTVREESIIMNSGELPRKGTTKFLRL
jgi:hypothetical protein